MVDQSQESAGNLNRRGKGVFAQGEQELLTMKGNIFLACDRCINGGSLYQGTKSGYRKWKKWFAGKCRRLVKYDSVYDDIAHLWLQSGAVGFETRKGEELSSSLQQYKQF